MRAVVIVMLSLAAWLIVGSPWLASGTVLRTLVRGIREMPQCAFGQLLATHVGVIFVVVRECTQQLLQAKRHQIDVEAPGRKHCGQGYRDSGNNVPDAFSGRGHVVYSSSSNSPSHRSSVVGFPAAHGLPRVTGFDFDAHMGSFRTPIAIVRA